MEGPAGAGRGGQRSRVRGGGRRACCAPLLVAHPPRLPPVFVCAVGYRRANGDLQLQLVPLARGLPGGWAGGVRHWSSWRRMAGLGRAGRFRNGRLGERLQRRHAVGSAGLPPALPGLQRQELGCTVGRHDVPVTLFDAMSRCHEPFVCTPHVPTQFVHPFHGLHLLYTSPAFVTPPSVSLLRTWKPRRATCGAAAAWR